ncbi:MAG: EamA family transporter [Janthinobacterium lividum]
MGGQAYLLLVFTMAVWAANSIAARLAVGEIAPMVLTLSRWTICCAALFLTSRRRIATPAIIQGTIPVFVPIGGLVLLGMCAGALQAVVGDMWIVTACAVAAVVSLPLALREIVPGHSFVPSGRGRLLLPCIGLLSSFVSQPTFIRAVALIGSARAGVFMNPMPVFGLLFAVAALSESLSLYHAAALGMVLGGIAIAEYLRPPAAPRNL